MDAPIRKVFRFEGFTLDQVRGSLRRGDHEIDIRPKTFELLQFLVENAGHLLSKDQIMRAVWPGVIVTEDSLVRCVHEARVALGDGDQRPIRTVPRRGYLLDVPVVTVPRERPPVAPQHASRMADRRMWGAALACTILLTGAVGGGLAWRQSSDQAVSRQPSIAVLPFVSLGDDGQQSSFTDGISEDLITSLASFPELSVVERNASFAYGTKPVPANQVGRELGVRYVLGGSVRREAEQLRITAHLVDAETDKQLWAKRYDRHAAEVFASQDEVTQEIAATLASSLRLADVTRTRWVPAERLSASELVLRARETTFRAATRQSTIEARELAQRAIMIDPGLASAHVELGRTYYRAFALQWDGPTALDQALESARHAISLDQASASAHELLGRVYLRLGRHDAAIATLEKTIALNPSRADSYASLADALTFAGRAADAVPLLEKAMRLDPYYPPRIDMYLGRALYFDQRYAEAELPLEACVARAPRFRPCYMYLAPVLAALGRMQEARRTVSKLLEISPAFTIGDSVRRHLPFVEVSMRHYTDGLRKAGVPE
jgi:TolB-like protein/DNA-binding winged helix-turn-helix (wHTH) protein/cytochrome c-type biogenesis protein CcmH/NrfG